MSLILKESPIGVTQTRPLFRLANLFRNIILHTKTKCKKLVIQCSIPGQETWAVQTSGTGNFSVRTRKNVIPVVRMDD